MVTKMWKKTDCDIVRLSKSVRSKAETLAHRLTCLACVFDKNWLVGAILKVRSKEILGAFYLVLTVKLWKKAENGPYAHKTEKKTDCDIRWLSKSVRWKTETLAHRLACLAFDFDINWFPCVVLNFQSKTFFSPFLGGLPRFGCKTVKIVLKMTIWSQKCEKNGLWYRETF